MGVVKAVNLLQDQMEKTKAIDQAFGFEDQASGHDDKGQWFSAVSKCAQADQRWPQAAHQTFLEV